MENSNVFGPATDFIDLLGNKIHIQPQNPMMNNISKTDTPRIANNTSLSAGGNSIQLDIASQIEQDQRMYELHQQRQQQRHQQQLQHQQQAHKSPSSYGATPTPMHSSPSTSFSPYSNTSPMKNTKRGNLSPNSSNAASAAPSFNLPPSSTNPQASCHSTNSSTSSSSSNNNHALTPSHNNGSNTGNFTVSTPVLGSSIAPPNTAPAVMGIRSSATTPTPNRVHAINPSSLTPNPSSTGMNGVSFLDSSSLHHSSMTLIKSQQQQFQIHQQQLQQQQNNAFINNQMPVLVQVPFHQGGAAPMQQHPYPTTVPPNAIFQPDHQQQQQQHHQQQQLANPQNPFTMPAAGFFPSQIHPPQLQPQFPVQSGHDSTQQQQSQNYTQAEMQTTFQVKLPNKINGQKQPSKSSSMIPAQSGLNQTQQDPVQPATHGIALTNNSSCHPLNQHHQQTAFSDNTNSSSMNSQLKLQESNNFHKNSTGSPSSTFSSSPSGSSDSKMAEFHDLNSNNSDDEEETIATSAPSSTRSRGPRKSITEDDKEERIQEAMRLVRFEQLSRRKAASQTGISPNTLKRRLNGSVSRQEYIESTKKITAAEELILESMLISMISQGAVFKPYGLRAIVALYISHRDNLPESTFKELGIPVPKRVGNGENMVNGVPKDIVNIPKGWCARFLQRTRFLDTGDGVLKLKKEVDQARMVEFFQNAGDGEDEESIMKNIIINNTNLEAYTESFSRDLSNYFIYIREGFQLAGWRSEYKKANNRFCFKKLNPMFSKSSKVTKSTPSKSSVLKMTTEKQNFRVNPPASAPPSIDMKKNPAYISAAGKLDESSAFKEEGEEFYDAEEGRPTLKNSDEALNSVMNLLNLMIDHTSTKGAPITHFEHIVKSFVDGEDIKQKFDLSNIKPSSETSNSSSTYIKTEPGQDPQLNKPETAASSTDSGIVLIDNQKPEAESIYDPSADQDLTPEKLSFHWIENSLKTVKELSHTFEYSMAGINDVLITCRDLLSHYASSNSAPFTKVETQKSEISFKPSHNRANNINGKRFASGRKVSSAFPFGPTPSSSRATSMNIAPSETIGAHKRVITPPDNIIQGHDFQGMMPTPTRNEGRSVSMSSALPITPVTPQLSKFSPNHHQQSQPQFSGASTAPQSTLRVLKRKESCEEIKEEDEEGLEEERSDQNRQPMRRTMRTVSRKRSRVDLRGNYAEGGPVLPSQSLEDIPPVPPLHEYTNLNAGDNGHHGLGDSSHTALGIYSPGTEKMMDTSDFMNDESLSVTVMFNSTPSMPNGSNQDENVSSQPGNSNNDDLFMPSGSSGHHNSSPSSFHSPNAVSSAAGNLRADSNGSPVQRPRTLSHHRSLGSDDGTFDFLSPNSVQNNHYTTNNNLQNQDHNVLEPNNEESISKESSSSPSHKTSSSGNDTNGASSSSTNSQEATENNNENSTEENHNNNDNENQRENNPGEAAAESSDNDLSTPGEFFHFNGFEDLSGMVNTNGYYNPPIKTPSPGPNSPNNDGMNNGIMNDNGMHNEQEVDENLNDNLNDNNAASTNGLSEFVNFTLDI